MTTEYPNKTMLINKIESFTVVSSTQNLMKQRLLKGENINGLVLRAAVQTTGRGQREHHWQSPLGGSYQTLAVKDAPPYLLNKPQVAPFMAVGLAKVFSNHNIKLSIKWPNDLYYQGKKVAGILCEYLKKHLLIGVGCNVNNPIPEEASKLINFSIEQVNSIVLEGLQYSFDLLNQNACLSEIFAPFDLLYGQKVRLNHQEIQSGIARGINEQGCLKIETKQGYLYLHQSQSLERLI